MEIDILSELLEISKDISNKYKKLGNLSIKNMENTSEYRSTVSELDECFLATSSICDELDFDTVDSLLSKLSNKSLNGSEYDIANDLLYTRYKEILYEMRNDDKDIDPTEFIDFIVYNSDFAKKYNIESFLEEMNPDTYEYFDLAITCIYIRAIQRMKHLIYNTPTYNESEKEISRRLIEDFKVAKYDFFTVNHFFEITALESAFDIDKLEDEDMPKIDFSSIFSNYAIYLLGEIYCLGIASDPSTTNDALFLNLCFEEIINYLDKERLIRLQNFMNGFEQSILSSFYISNCYRKIKCRIN